MARTGSEIAIVGMSLRVPGGRTVEDFWRNLRGGVESVVPLTDDELRAAGVSDAHLRDPNYVRAAAVLDDIEAWDAPFFGFSPKDAAIMDPQHRLFLECAWEALEDSSHLPERFDGSMGVFAGCGMQAYMSFNLLPNKKLIDQVGLFLVRHTGNDKDFLSTRVSYLFNLKGPSISVQTACSTSLAAVHLAAQSLLSGECDLALAGGVTIMLPHRVGYLYEEGEILSPDGHCRPFDAAGQGTVFGSGAGVMVLRRLEDALADRDHVYAVIRGSAVNNDGSGKVSYLAPSVDGQAAAVAEAIAIADVDPASVTYVEAHGTGTAVGDPIEVAALTQVYGTGERRRCALGSVKSNIGHLDTAAGIISLAKAALALEREEIPPTVHFRAPNPAIDFDAGPFYVNADPVPWPRGSAPRRAGVSSLGVGGTNVHVILEEAPAAAHRSSPIRPRVLCLSARSTSSLDAAAANLAEHLRERPNLDMADVAFTLGERRAFRERRVILATEPGDVAAALQPSDRRRSASGSASAADRSVAFMFAGGGAQYPGMGRALYRSESVYRDAVDECLSELDAETSTLLRTLLEGDRSSADLSRQLERPSLALPALLTSQIAMARLAMSWGLTPAAMIGHSMGEYTAACLAGVFPLRDALRLVQVRGQLFERVPRGGMLSVPLSADALRAVLGPELSLAAENAPHLCVASGPDAALRALEAGLKAQDVEGSRIRIDIAAHSSMLDGILDDFRRFVQSIRLSPPTIPIVSNLTGDWMRTEDATDPEYWVRHLRNTVRFSSGIRLLLDDGSRALLEIGPGRTMATLARLNAPAGRTTPIVTSMAAADEAGLDDRDAALLGIGELWCHGVPMDWTAMRGGDTPARIPLPVYAFERSRHWIDAPPAGAAPAADDTSRRPWQEWFYAADWERTGAVAPSAGDAAGSTRVSVVLDDGTPIGRAVADELRSGGGTVVTVRRGPRFERADPLGFVADPRAVDDFGRLIDALAAFPGVTDIRFVHCWTVDGPTPSQALSQDEAEERAFYSILHLAQAWGRADLSIDAELVLLTSGLWTVGGETPGEPWRALALGPLRVIPAEYPNLRTRVLDVGAAGHDDAARRLARRVAAELSTMPGPTEVAFRGGERWRRAFRALDLPAAASGGGALTRGGVYVVTGGFGGIGAALAERLAGEYGARLALVGRHAGSASAADVAARCAARGAEVLPISADVSDANDARRVLDEARRRFGRIDGVFHAAGVLDDGLLQLRSDNQCAAVLAPKVRGTIALETALGPDSDCLFVLFSSISAEAGLPGQADYAAASAFLDAFAARRRANTGGLTVSVQWGPWVDVGMAARGGGPAGDAVASLSHPVLTRLERSGAQRTVSGTLDCDTHWVVGQHRLRSGEALIPGTGYLELACAAFGASRAVEAIEVRDVAFLSPFLVKDGEPREVRVSITETGGASRFTVLGADSHADQPAWSEHAAGAIAAVPRPPDTAPGEAALVDAVLPVAEIRARCAARVDGPPVLSANPFLNLGARWECVREVRFGAKEAIGHLRLPDAFQAEAGQYRLHPALLDMATACGLGLVPRFDPAVDFYVPLSYTTLRSYAPMPAEVYAHVRMAESDLDPREVAVFDVTICAPDGRVVADIDGFMMTRVADRAALTVEAPARRRAAQARGGDEPLPARGPRPPADGITASEGLDALIRILDGEAPSTVTVTWRPPAAVIRELHELAAPEAHAQTVAASQPEFVPEVEKALGGHEAVAECTALARPDRTGTMRVVAYVVFKPDGQATVSELRRHCKKLVEERLVPAAFITLDSLPKRVDGRPDRPALPDPYGTADEHVAPRTEIEKIVAETWKDVLGVDKVSVHDNFFDIGGHSLLAVRVVTRLDRKLGVRLSQAAMVLQTLEQLSAECERQRGGVAVHPA